MDKKTKIRLFVAGAVELVIVVFCLVVSIWVMATITDPNIPDHANQNFINNGPFIGWFQNNSTPFFLIIVLPLFVLLALDVIYLIVFATKRESSLSASERHAIEEQAKREAREEVLREMAEEEKKDKKE